MPGYEVKFVNPLLKRHECPVCLYAMRNPVQTECGHLFCRECLDPVLKRKRPICPLDKEDINADSIFPDNACRREILNLEVYCPFVSGGCEWIGQLKKLEVSIIKRYNIEGRSIELVYTCVCCIECVRNDNLFDAKDLFHM